MTASRIALVWVASSAVARSTVVAVAAPGYGQDLPGIAAGTALHQGQVTQRTRTPAGSAITVTHAKFTHGKRRVKATIEWNRALRVKAGDHRYAISVVALKGVKHRGSVLASWSGHRVSSRSSVEFWLGVSQVRKARAAKVVQLSVSQQYDSPKDRDRKYERNYLSTAYLKGMRPGQPPAYRDCSNVTIEPGADLSGCNLSGAKLPGANLAGANLNSARADLADFSGAVLRGAKMMTILAWTKLSNADMAEALLEGAPMNGANLQGVDLTGAFLARAHLSEANLSGARMLSVSLVSADLTGANLTSANLTSANLFGANLEFANIRDVTLKGAYLYGARWPSGRVCKAPSVGRCD